ncbi:MAG: hypothetical protein ACR2N8_05550 [Parvibaculales bacterium]
MTMTDNHNFQRLQAEIFALSEAKNDWDAARKEWALAHIEFVDEPETCLCGHHPIREVCTIKNHITQNSTEVGNVCVKRFLGIRSDLVFTAIKRIEKDKEKSLNTAAVEFFKEKGLLTDWEYDFLQSTLRKRSMSPKQMAVRQKINHKVLREINRRGFQGNANKIL